MLDQNKISEILRSEMVEADPLDRDFSDFDWSKGTRGRFAPMFERGVTFHIEFPEGTVEMRPGCGKEEQLAGIQERYDWNDEKERWFIKERTT